MTCLTLFCNNGLYELGNWSGKLICKIVENSLIIIVYKLIKMLIFADT